MRDPARIPRILDALRTVWQAYPDMRFGQLLINLGLAPDTLPLWVCEDDATEAQIHERAESFGVRLFSADKS